MKKLILLVALVGCWGMVNAQWTDAGSQIWTNDKVGIGTSNPIGILDIQNSGYTGFFLKETSGSGAAQFRFRANVGAFIFDDVNGVQQARLEFNGGSNQVNFFNDAGGNFLFRSSGESLYFTNQGRLGVGTLAPQSTLSVNGKMESEEVQVKQDVADYVFKSDYNLMSLEELDIYIQENGYLPRIQNQFDVDENRGLVKLGELSVSLMEKVEELTLHIIELNKRINALESDNAELKENKVKK